VPEALEGSGEEERCFDKLSNRRREKRENWKRDASTSSATEE
jgi:hypothetical protein